VVPKATKFNYKRQILPSAINSTTYGRDNQHLPPRMTRDDYAQMLFYTVAHNDVDGTRALLNAGTYINSLNIYGETPLAFARRAGSQDVAALLAARGARY
jgi:ankyrin repeat protein